MPPPPYMQLSTTMYRINVYVSMYPPYLIIHTSHTHALTFLHTSYFFYTCALFKEVLDFG